jgi:hypothetical protein
VRGQEVSYPDPPGAETPKYQTLNSEASRLRALRHIGTFPIGTSHLVGTRNKNCPLGSRVPKRPKHPRLYVLSHFGISPIGISGLARTGETYPCVFRVPKRRNVDPIHTMPYRDFASRDFAIQEDEESHSSISRVPKSRYTHSSYPRPKFGVSRIGDSRCAQTGGLASRSSGSRNSEVPTLNLRIYFGISPIGISRVGDSGLASTRNSPLGIPGTETPRSYNFSILLPFRDFASRGFGTCEYKGILPWVFRVPKHRNVLTYPHAVISGFRESGFRDLRVQGNSHLGTPGAETPKCPKSKRTILSRAGFFRLTP